MKIEVLGGNNLRRLPGEGFLPGLEAWAVSVPLEGKMYDVDLIREGDDRWLRKTLKTDSLSRFYGDLISPSEVFQRHFLEHQITLSYLGDFCVPTMFYVETVAGQSFFRILQPWVRAAVQYKEAVMTGRKLTQRQLPEYSLRAAFLAGISRLVANIYPELPDFDFFVTEDRDIAVFDTTGFWIEKREGKDRANIAFNFARFLFTDSELATREISELVGVLGGVIGG